LRNRVGATWTHVVLSEIFARLPITDSRLASKWNQVLAARYGLGRPQLHHTTEHTGIESLAKLPIVDPYSKFDRVVKSLSDQLSRRVQLWPHDSNSLTAIGGEMDLAVQMPGWANVWTRPIQNRVDMLATGINSEIGVRVLGKDFDTVVRFSEHIAGVVRDLHGAIGVVADPVREKNYVDVLQLPDKVAQHNLEPSSVELFLSAATTGIKFGALKNSADNRNMRLVLTNYGDDADSLLDLPIQAIKAKSLSGSNAAENKSVCTLREIAIVQHRNGPATIKSENGWIRNYVRLNVQGISPLDFVSVAKQRVHESLVMPRDVRLEWTGQFEHAAETRQTMLWMIPIVLVVIFGILFVTFRDFADAGLMMLSVPGSIAGGILCQWLLGVQFSIAVGIGYISCFGMAAATSVVMLIFLRESVANAGGLKNLTLSDLRETIIRGAVQRLRPKLLTELTLIVSLAPMIWSSGVGADVIRPMAAPVLGGILIADEVVDLLIPVAFYIVRRRRWRKLHADVGRPMLEVAK
jgi:copper/silver efflux system protein